ncbi:MAG: AAA family ATPase [Bacteroidota bacterium]
MAYSISIPFYAFTLRFSPENTLRTPLSDATAVRLNEEFHLLAGRYAEVFQKKVINKGDYQQLLNEYLEGDYQELEIEISFKASKDKISYPEFSLTFVYFSKVVSEKGAYWGIVPALGVETFANDELQLEENIEEAIYSEFIRQQRGKSVRAIIATIWYEAIEMQKQAIDFRFPSLKELEDIQEGKEVSLLPKIAKKIEVSRTATYGRKELLNQLTKAVKGKFNRNILLVGASGVGKTALVWELVRQKDKRKITGEFWETTASTMIKELTGETGWQDNLALVCRELAKSNDFLFVRNFMELFEVGQYSGNTVSMADYLRPYVGRGELTLISECTEEERARIELRSPNYLSLFQVIRMEAPQKDLEEIIIKKVKDLASNRRIGLETEAIKETLRLNRRFTPYAGLPGKPIRFLESILISQKPSDKKSKKTLVGRSEVTQYFCEETGMPNFIIDPTVPMNPTAIKRQFNDNVFGQEKAVDSIVNLLASVKTALTKTGKPIASFLFVGPTGVGKTELAKVLAQFMFGHRDKMVRFDMSEYADAYSVMRLTGVSYGSDGLLTAAVRRTPFCVLLFDEIEKAHANFFDLLLQILSEGRLTDSSGRLVNFCSTIIIMTSNIGATNLQSNRIRIKKTVETEAIHTHFISAVQQFFRPELFGRIDEVIPFAPLSNDVIHFVVEREIALFKKLEGIQFRRLELKIDPEVYDYLATVGYSPEYGARQLQRTIKEHLIIPLAQQLNQYDNEDQLIAAIQMVDDKVEIAIDADPLGLDLLLEELEKIDYADHASELRRGLAGLEEGRAFVRLLSEIEVLERQKKKQAEAFWNNQKKAKKYAYLLESREKLYQLKQAIDTHEQAVSLAYMGFQAYNPKITQALKDWQKSLSSFKTELAGRIYPHLNQTFLAIYGIHPQSIMHLYLEIAERKGFKTHVKSIWYRERLYKSTTATQEDEKGRAIVKNHPQNKQYLALDFENAGSKKLTPPTPKDILCGVILKISGPCVHLFLKDEGGLHLLEDVQNPKEFQKYLLTVTETEPTIPEDIHRKDFYSKLPAKRILTPYQIYDKQTKWSSDIQQKGEYAGALIQYKNEDFKRKLDSELF